MLIGPAMFKVQSVPIRIINYKVMFWFNYKIMPNAYNRYRITHWKLLDVVVAVWMESIIVTLDLPKTLFNNKEILKAVLNFSFRTGIHWWPWFSSQMQLTRKASPCHDVMSNKWLFTLWWSSILHFSAKQHFNAFSLRWHTATHRAHLFNISTHWRY